MGTCIREGQSYKRHWWNDEGICELCGHKSPWALYMEQERLETHVSRLKPLQEQAQKETILETTDKVIGERLHE